MANYQGYGVQNQMPQQLTPQQMYQLQMQMQQMNSQPMPTPTPPQNDERIWVANEQSAENYLVAPNAFVRLWNSNENIFYEKRADATGRPLPIECYRYEKIEPHRATNDKSATIDYQKQINSLNGRIMALEKAVKKNG